ncbi:hypothetical protein [Actinomadura madurae]|uniref:hypothetical protein n=1 Tax=Actinomadura madurae TaxID=1993 RepID=UPI0020D21AB1|nr:hypothetical protein [Actinomadura madurae]MCP9947308.1 hypothetical protein [Actinomadura madurae]MCP9964070.1 hypothetical protein [Actinomadura madurae]MCP9976544.1 hypothetical protein [Actinomadura madurae]MCQ0011958.1 hypothetical protein [Actinomadura madurae]MCQ0012741.1 hypothetical protein [Actinomadura madurae]
MAITVTLAAPRTKTAPAFFGITTGEQIVQAAARAGVAFKTLTGLGLSDREAAATLEAAADNQITTVAIAA